MQDFFRCQADQEEKAERVASLACKKLIKDMHYEARVQAVINYKAKYEGTKVRKPEARNLTLSRAEYLLVILISLSD